MDIRNSFESKYLRSSDILGRPNQCQKLQIRTLVMEKLRARNGAEELKPIIYFAAITKRGFVLNRTCAQVLGEAFGWETEGWIGRWIELFVTPVQAFGETVDAIRVRLPVPDAWKGQNAQQAARPAAVRPLQRQVEPMQQAPETFEDPDDVGGAFDEPEPGELDADGNPF